MITTLTKIMRLNAGVVVLRAYMCRHFCTVLPSRHYRVFSSAIHPGSLHQALVSGNSDQDVFRLDRRRLAQLYVLIFGKRRNIFASSGQSLRARHFQGMVLPPCAAL